MKKYAAFCLLHLPLWASIENGRVTRITSTQIVVAYQAPSEAACTVEVSENPGYSPLVADVNPSLFAGSDNDLGRYATLQSGTTRQFVVGTRKYQRASDGRVYSRALAAAQQHYIRVRCGADELELTAGTGTIPFGSTYVDPAQPSDLYDGELITPTLYDVTRGGSFIDPATGAKIYRMSSPGDLDFGDTDQDVNFAAVDASPNWVSGGSILAQDSVNAVYNGTSCGATCDWIRLRQVSVWYVTNSVDYIRLKLVGSGNQATAADRTIEWGLAKAIGGSCASSPLDGTLRTMLLPFNTNGQVNADVVRGDLLRPPTAAQQLITAEILAAGGFCVLVRKATTTGTIQIDHAKFDGGESASQTTGSGGNPTLASDIKDANGFMTVTTETGGARAVLYKVKMEPTVDIRYLGYVRNISGGQCLLLGHSATVDGRMYCQPTGTSKLVQLDYVGDSTNKTAPYSAELVDTELATNLASAVATFVSGNSSHYPVAFDASKFGCAFNGIVQGDLLQIVCRRGIQDSYAWVAVWRLGTGIVGAYATWMHKTSRWCGHHSHEEIGQYGGLFLWTSHFLTGGSVGTGQYSTTLSGSINGSVGRLTVSGQPSSPQADTYLMDLAAGDTLVIDGEVLTVTSVAGFPEIQVTRGAFGSTASSHSSGAVVGTICAGDPNGASYQHEATMSLWDPIADPFGDGSGISNKTYRGHETIRPGLGANNSAFSLDTLRVGQDLDYSYGVLPQPPFAGHVPPGAGVSYQTHPTKHTTIGTDFAKRVFADTRPLVGGNLFSGFVNVDTCNPAFLLPSAGGCAAQRVSGTTDTYKYTFSGSDRPEPALAYRHMPVFAISGTKNLRNISGAGSLISDTTPYSFCVALLAGECRPDASPGDMFLSAPGVTYFGCSGGEVFTGGKDLCIAERAAGTASLTEHNTTPEGQNLFSSRDLALTNSIASTMRFSSGASTKHLPDGTGLMYTYIMPERADVFILKIPPYAGASDSVARQDFEPISVDIRNVPEGATRVLVKFGYGTDFQCSPNRLEACYATQTVIDGTRPFLWDTEITSTSGLDVSGGCTGSCTVVIPAITNRVGMYQLIYRDSSGGVIATLPPVVF